MSDIDLTITPQVVEVVEVSGQGPAGPAGPAGPGISQDFVDGLTNAATPLNVANPVVTAADQTATNTGIATIGAPPYTTAQEMLDITMSSGLITEPVMTDNGDGSVALPAFEVLFRVADDNISPIVSADMSAYPVINLTDNSDNWVYADYNAGTPVVAVSTTQPLDRETKPLIGVVYRRGTTLHITQSRRKTASNATDRIVERLLKTFPGQIESGGVLSDKGGRRLAMTGAIAWQGNNSITLPAFDMSTGSTVEQAYRDGVGGWTVQTGITALNNTHYDNGTGTLAPLNPNQYTNRWIYAHSDTDDATVVYGTTSHPTLAAALAAPVPTAPPWTTQTTRLVGRAIVRNGENEFVTIQNVVASGLQFQPTTDHEGLSNLQGGGPGEHYHLLSAESVFLDALRLTGGAARLKGADEVTPTTHDMTAGGTLTLDYPDGNNREILADGTAFIIAKGTGWPTSGGAMSLVFRQTGTDGTLPTITFSGFTFLNGAPDLSGVTPDTGGAVLELKTVTGGTLQGVWGVY